jgi:aspartokinase
MKRIAEVVEELVLAAPLLEDGLGAEIINLSALARRLKPAIESALMKEVSEASVMMALRRLSPALARRRRSERAHLKRIGELTVRSDLVALTFQNSDSVWECQKRLLHRLQRGNGLFLTYTQGAREVMVIASAGAEEHVRAAFRKEKLLARVARLSAIVIRLAPDTVETPGIYYTILKRLAWSNLNVVDVVSTRTEFTVVVDTGDIERAFAILRRYLWS